MRRDLFSRQPRRGLVVVLPKTVVVGGVGEVDDLGLFLRVGVGIGGGVFVGVGKWNVPNGLSTTRVPPGLSRRLSRRARAERSTIDLKVGAAKRVAIVIGPAIQWWSIPLPTDQFAKQSRPVRPLIQTTSPEMLSRQHRRAVVHDYAVPLSSWRDARIRTPITRGILVEGVHDVRVVVSGEFTILLVKSHEETRDVRHFFLFCFWKTQRAWKNGRWGRRPLKNITSQTGHDKKAPSYIFFLS